MKPLLEIQTVPISIEFKVTPAIRQKTEATAELEITREKNGLRIKSHPIQLNIDTFETRSSLFDTPLQSITTFAQKGKEAAYAATARFAEEGNMLLDIHLNEDALSKIGASRIAEQEKDFNIAFLPSAPPDINWTPGDIQIQYEMDKLNFEWKTNQGNFEFVPANIEFNITQHPQVIIKYVGSPLYIPQSANPDYEPLDVKA
ncbi:DUF6470 family protein [Sinanaerobacter sp. ZZT-01]|uniref:DUF6470 family protein n=1 Tax=Sinanaerobacter sp. ZZT-01 TaxID=3111540 RepID=UPI002D772EBD|nr:DUF6470 family protein [Sinanaerobacter sp. ZZT-01]WRR93587.1 DUF6470 family protein [Sinanaerobacter sp. ZZT-01]